jgi:hypothetical protein
MIATEMPAAMRPYSIAVAPFSSRRKDFRIAICASPEFCAPAGPCRRVSPDRFHFYPEQLKIGLAQSIGFDWKMLGTLAVSFAGMIEGGFKPKCEKAPGKRRGLLYSQ